MGLEWIIWGHCWCFSCASGGERGRLAPHPPLCRASPPPYPNLLTKVGLVPGEGILAPPSLPPPPPLGKARGNLKAPKAQLLPSAAKMAPVGTVPPCAA